MKYITHEIDAYLRKQCNTRFGSSFFKYNNLDLTEIVGKINQYGLGKI